MFLEANKELLATIPPPMVALNYYKNQDLYLVSGQQSQLLVADMALEWCWPAFVMCFISGEVMITLLVVVVHSVCRLADRQKTCCWFMLGYPARA